MEKKFDRELFDQARDKYAKDIAKLYRHLNKWLMAELDHDEKKATAMINRSIRDLLDLNSKLYLTYKKHLFNYIINITDDESKRDALVLFLIYVVLKDANRA